MLFLARIRPGTALERRWRDRRQTEGMVCGVRFRWFEPGPGGITSGSLAAFYESDELDADQIARLRDNPMIELVAVTRVSRPPPAPPIPEAAGHA